MNFIKGNNIKKHTHHLIQKIMDNKIQYAFMHNTIHQFLIKIYFQKHK